MKMQSSLRNERGLSLLEALVSTAIFAVIAGGVSSLVRTAFVTSGLNISRNHAIAVAEDRLEELRSFGYDDLLTLAPGGTGLPGTEARSGVSFQIATLIEPNVPDANMAQVNVTVTWDHRGTTRTHSVSTIYTEVFGGA